MREGYRRYAIYWTPEPDSVLARQGAAWLGWDPVSATGEAPDDPRLAAPWRYGLHATMKAPFRLATGTEVEALDAAIADFAGAQAPVLLPGPVLDDALGFFAIRPGAPCRALEQLAAKVVEVFDPFRAPLNAAERARRDMGAMTQHQRALFERWGYPHVMEAFRFHITLTGRIAPEHAAATRRELEARFGPALDGGITIASLTLLGDPGPDEAGGPRGFVQLARHALTGAD
ncbi:MAG: DUF1045 domain-containing protein [Pseudomonadota bacterium]